MPESDRANFLALDEQRFRELAEMSSDWFWEQDADFRYTALFGAAYADGRLNPQTTLGRRRWELGITGISEAQWQAHRALLERHEPFRNFTYQYVNPLGQTRWFSVNGKPTFDSKAVFTGYRGTGHDVTEQKLADLALRESEAELRLVTDNAPASICYIDQSLIVRGVNRAFIRLFAREAADLIGRHLRDAVGAVTYAEIEGHFNAALCGQATSYRRANAMPNVADSFLDVTLVPHRDVNGQVIGCYGIAVDATNMRKTEEEVRNLQRLFTSTFQSTTDLMAVYRLESDALVIEGFNQALTRFYESRYANVRITDWIGRPVDEFLREVSGLVSPDLDRRLARFWQCVRTRDLIHYQTDMPTPAGAQRRDVLLIPITNAGGAVTHLFYRGTDVTALHTKEEELQALNAGLERRIAERTADLTAANADLESFSYSVSHDLRAPLRAINGFSQVLLEDAGATLSAASAGHLKKIRDNTLRMSTLIDDMLDLASVTRKPLSLTCVDLSRIAAEIASALALSEPARQVEWQLAGGVTLTADAGLMRQLLANLLGNAWKYSRGRQPARIEFGCTESGEDGVRLFVRDNGAGFDMAYVSKLFQPFQRLHSPGQFEGLGIGLAIVARIAQRHGGAVSAEGKEGGGATFYVALPQPHSGKAT